MTSTRAALLKTQPGEWELESVELDSPKAHEVLVKMAAAGLCHSDDHFPKNDLVAARLPACGGHEGAGVVVEVGPEVHDLRPGDHVVTVFVPCCGKCRWCASSMQNLCDSAGGLAYGAQLDGTYRMHLGDTDVAQMSRLGTFSEYTVISDSSCVRIPEHIPLTSAALLGCGVPTGWGSAVNGAAVSPGDAVIVAGVGGIGINAVQGASHAGAAHVIAVDPLAFKRENALKLGATHAYGSIEEATEFVRTVTNGQGADSAILTMSLLRSEDVAAGFAAIRKAGTVVVTAVANERTSGIPVNLFELAMYQKRIQGVLYGMCSPTKDVPRLIRLYESGDLRLDDLITTRYPLEKVNEAYADLGAGRNIRGIIEF